MRTTVETRTGTCPTHGGVEGTRDMPQPGFPFILYLFRRAMAGRRPFRCPTCGAPVTTG
jgi:hypothetical protein